MKKVLVLIAFLSAIFYGYSQTSIATALPLQEGSNSYTFENTEGETIVYYTYTAPTEQGKLVAFTAANSSVSSQMSLDGTYSTMITGVPYNNYTTTLYPVMPGQTVILAVSGYNITTVEFNIELKDADVDAGATCQDAIELSETEVFMPSYYDRNTYNTYPTYLSYTCEEDGLLEIHFSGSLSALTKQTGCDATSTEEITVNYTSNGYLAKCEVLAGESYIFQATTYSSLMVSAILTHPVKGQSCDLPFEGAAVNTLPKEAGKYWYSYTTDKAGYMVISSESSLAGGTLSIWSSCTAYEANATIDGYFAIRTQVYSGYEYLICVEKNESTAEDENFTITIEDEQAGDSQYNPIVITDNQEITVPQYNGTYYYSLTTPEGDSRFLVIDATSANINNSNTQVSIHNEYDTYTALASGRDYARSEVLGNTQYIIKWVCNEGYNSFPFTISYEEIAQGETCSNPLIAIEGANDLAAGSDKYYTYTATRSGWLVIDTEVSIDVTFLRGCSNYDGTFYATKIANITKTELMEGETCIIKFANIEEETTFFLSEEDYKAGESCETAIDINLGSNALPESVGNYWYRYTATQSGMLTVSSDIIYEQSSDYTRSSAVKVLTNCDEYGNNITQTGADGTIFRGSFVINEGDVIFINVVTISAQSGKSLTLEIRDLNPGEACDNPIDITPGELTLPIVSRSNPVWYAIELGQGELSISSDNYNYFSMFLYDSCDATNYLASSQYDSQVSGYSLKYTVVTEGKYLLKLDGTYNEITVKVEGKYSSLNDVMQQSQIRVMGNNIIINALNQRTEVAIYDITGKIIASQAVYDNATFNVEKGIYIVKIGDKVAKVIIR